MLVLPRGFQYSLTAFATRTPSRLYLLSLLPLDLQFVTADVGDPLHEVEEMFIKVSRNP